MTTPSQPSALRASQRALWPSLFEPTWPAAVKAKPLRLSHFRAPTSWWARRHLYPVDWKQVAEELKEANNWRCLACNRQCLRPGESSLLRTDPRLRAQHTLTCAHAYPADHNPAAPVVVIHCLCAPCHLRFDLERRNSPPPAGLGSCAMAGCS